MDSYTFTVARGLQRIGRAINEEPVRRAIAEGPLNQVAHRLCETYPECRFLTSYEELCWQSGKSPPSWRGRPPFWSEGVGDAQTLLAIRSAMLGISRDVEATHRDCLRTRHQYENRVRSLFVGQRPELLERFEKMLGWTRYWTQALNDRHGLAVGLLWEKELVWQVGERLCREGLLEEPAEVLVLGRDDMEAIAQLDDPCSRRDVYLARRSEYRRNRRLNPPGGIGPSDEENTAASSKQSANLRAAPASSSAAKDDGPIPPDAPLVLEGEVFAGGEASGRARPVYDISDPSLLDKLTADDILVLPHEHAFFYAEWHSLLTLVRGVVSPGRPSHHLTQVARECGVPVVGHVEGDLGSIPEGVRILIGGREGTVEVFADPS